MVSRLDRKAVLWIVFFVVLVLAILDIMRPESFLVDLFSGTRTPEGRLQRAMRRAIER